MYEDATQGDPFERAGVGQWYMTENSYYVAFMSTIMSRTDELLDSVWCHVRFYSADTLMKEDSTLYRHDWGTFWSVASFDEAGDVGRAIVNSDTMSTLFSMNIYTWLSYE